METPSPAPPPPVPQGAEANPSVPPAVPTPIDLAATNPPPPAPPEAGVAPPLPDQVAALPDPYATEPSAEETPEIIQATPTLEQPVEGLAPVTPEAPPKENPVEPQIAAEPKIANDIESPPATQEPPTEENPVEPQIEAEPEISKDIPLSERERDPRGGILLNKDEDISLRYPAGMLLKSDETSECWNGLEEDMSIKDDDLRLFDLILQDAINEDVADLHIKEDHYIHFRMSRGLRDRDWPKPTRQWIEKIIFHMCPEHFVEGFKEDREVDFSYFDPKFGRFRVNVFSQCSQWAMAMRYIKNDMPPIEKLGIHPICLQLAESKRGLTILAGITGSGKSTTMAAMVLHLNRHFRKHIVTIEDPVEMMFEDEQCVIEQREVGLDTMSFNRALKSALRQDPDMVLVGEMRDATSIGACLRAADTGAMVLSTVHTRTAASVPGRLLDFFPEEEREMQRKKYAEVIVGAIAQRMCPTTDGGMCPAQEVMTGSPLVKQKIFDGELNRLPACIDASEDDGMFSFNRCMYNLYEEGRITKEIALANCTNPQQLEMWFQGIQINTGIV